MAGKKKRDTKGIFSDARLPIAKRYVVPGSRLRPLFIRVAGAALVLAFALTFLLRGGRAVSPGPVSFNHANFERNCNACHTHWGAVAASSCLVCHGRVGEPEGAFSFAAHYSYRSGEARTPPPGHPKEVTCAVCHREHGGRSANLAAVADGQCQSCHRFSFDRGHPEIEVLRSQIPHDRNVHFPHRLHVLELRKQKGFEDLQLACFSCHRPDARGDHFEPIDFSRDCQSCHLPSGTNLPRLPVADAANPNAAGVETLAAAQQRSERWAFEVNPNDFQQVGNGVVKRNVHHADPWILDNLLRIRRILHPNLGLAALPPAGIDRVPQPGEGGALYREAIGSLRDSAEGLRGSPRRDVQDQLRQVDKLLATAERRLGERGGIPAAAASPFVVAASDRNPALSAAQVSDLNQLAQDLTAPCQQCHVVADAAILQVKKDQRTLTRTEFSHKVHLLQRPFCVDCHSAIPGLADPPDAAGNATAKASPLDVPTTQNLPGIAVCRQCHTASEASDRCITCHQFHPGATGRADLVVYRADAGGS